MKLIERPAYLNRLKHLRGTPDVKVITGIRRAGKSKLLQMFTDYLSTLTPGVNIIVIDYADMAFESLKEYHNLNSYVLEHTKSRSENILIVDEAQLCPHFEIAINSLHASEKYDIYITGSNAFMLNTDLSTLFTGRQIEIQVFPFSFREYCAYHTPKDTHRAFDHYVVEGGMAGSYNFPDDEEKENYIKEVYTTILTRDLTQRYRIADNQVLLRLTEYMMDNVSNITSPNNVANTLTANSLASTHVTIGNYLRYLCNAYVLYKIDRYDIRGKKYLSSLSKYYIADTGIRFAILGRRNMDWGRIYENIVCMELLRRGYRVYVGKLYKKEVDFVIMKGNEKAFIQVSDNISEQSTFLREVTPLLSIQDSYPKIIIARTRHEEYDYRGIRIIDIADWLLK